MVNMKKHSLATAVVLKFEINNNIFSVKYTDNGVGIKDFEKNMALESKIRKTVLPK